MGLFGHHDLREDVDGGPAMLFRDAQRRKAGFHQGVNGLLRILVVLVALLEVVLEVAALHDGPEAFQ